MHNLAIALHLKGHDVTGSDDEIFEPSNSRLEQHGILPEKTGWDPNRITTDLDGVILGMHAKQGNPELDKAKELNLQIYSFPEFLAEHAKDKKRIVIGGSHGKTTITAMLMHILREEGFDFDYLVGAQLKGFDVMVRLSDSAPIMIFEGDEYLTSALDPRPKFHLYNPHIALISGIAWDHINVFPTFQNYLEQFAIFIDKIEKDGTLVYYHDDIELQKLASESAREIKKISYSIPDYKVVDDSAVMDFQGEKYPMKVFGDHNLANLEGTAIICRELGIQRQKVLSSMTRFEGAAKRLELVREKENSSVFTDFAHAPSKLYATINAVKKQYPERKLLACMELHTYSSLSQEFLSHYKGTMDSADLPVVYFNPHAIKLKKLDPITRVDILKAFQNENLEVFDDSNELKAFLLQQNWKNTNLLMMSSGNYDGIDLQELADTILGQV